MPNVRSSNAGSRPARRYSEPMPKFAANLTLLFNEVPFLDRFERAAAAGFEAVEFLFPYAWDTSEIKTRLDANGLRAVLHNLPPGDWDGGERGLACVPGREADFRAGVARGIECALALGVPQIHCLSGIMPAGVDEGLLRDTYLANLRHAADEMKKAGLKALIEPINRIDMPGVYLHRTAQAVALMDELRCGNLFLQYDIYHAQRNEGELATTLERLLPRIGHIQIADNPGRHEPGSGEINYDFLFAQLDRIGYAGWVGCEYRPATTTEAGLGWFQRATNSSRSG
jgi:hydroxypyruvate isomerase